MNQTFFSLTFGANHGELTREIRNATRMDFVLRAETPLAVSTLGRAVFPELKKQFQAGTNKYGESHDASGQGPSLQSFHLTDGLGWVRIIMSGGSAYIESGQPRHDIVAHTDFLHFRMHDGRWVRTERVDHPAVAADEFVERAIGIVATESVLAKIATRVFSTFGLEHIV